MKKLLITIALCALGGSVGAAQMYKCTVNGKVTYSDKPCETGTESKVGVYVPPTDYEGLRIKNRQKSLANQIDREKEQQQNEYNRAAQQRNWQAQQEVAKKDRCINMRQQQQAREDAVRRQGGTDGEAARARVRYEGEAIERQCAQ